MANLVSDRPITSEDEDVLGLTSFADALAKSLAEMAPDDGLVISVQGEWGAGKTSAIELAQRRLVIRELAREHNIPLKEVEGRDWKTVQADWNSIVLRRRTHIIRFNPWNFSGQENLVRAFFREVGATIGHPPDGPIGKAINKLTNQLPAAGTLLGGVVGGLTTGTVAIGAGAALGRATGEGAQKLLSSSSSLESAKRELADALRSSGKRRLLPSEMRAMFSLVKSLGDLPNVLYVLSFDDQAVKRAIKSGTEPIDAAFLEKIVQVPLKLPPPWEPEVRQLFFSRLNAIIGDATPADQSRWQRAFLDAVAPYIKTPRGVARFANTLQVVWPNVEGDVDLTDLVILIALQLFDAKVYDLIFDNIEALAGESISFEEDKTFAARFEPKKAADNPDAAKEALAHLFPKLAKGWNTYSSDRTPYVKKREQRRICTREYYRNYFLFGRDPDRVSRSEIEVALSGPDPEKSLRDLIRKLANHVSRRGVSRVGALLDQIFEIVFSKPMLSAAVTRAMINLSDELISREDMLWELFVTDNFERLESILRFGLEPLSLGDRIARVQLIASHNSGLNICARIVEHLAGEHGLYGHKPRFADERLIPISDAKKAVAKILTRIRKAARTRQLLQAPKPMHLIWAWKRLSPKPEVNSWLAKQMKDDEFVLQIAEALPDTSYHSGGYGQKVIRSIRADTYKHLLDINVLSKRLKKLAQKSDAPESAKRILAEFLAAETAGKNGH